MTIKSNRSGAFLIDRGGNLIDRGTRSNRSGDSSQSGWFGSPMGYWDLGIWGFGVIGLESNLRMFPSTNSAKSIRNMFFQRTCCFHTVLDSS